MNTHQPHWQDEYGAYNKTPTIAGRLKFAKIPLHAALRRFIFKRDNFTCAACGAKPVEPIPTDFSGRHTLATDRLSKAGNSAALVVDHITSRRNGGSHHPSNLQTLCDSCNAAKVGLVDSKAGR